MKSMVEVDPIRFFPTPLANPGKRLPQLLLHFVFMNINTSFQERALYRTSTSTIYVAYWMLPCFISTRCSHDDMENFAFAHPAFYPSMCPAISRYYSYMFYACIRMIPPFVSHSLQLQVRSSAAVRVPVVDRIAKHRNT
jgi:hypothetical protein